MARTASVETIARTILSGSCINVAEVQIATKTDLHSTLVRRNMGALQCHDTVKVPFEVMHDDRSSHAPVVATGKMQNDLPLHGMIYVDGMPVEFYGSESAWRKLAAQK